MKPIPTAENSLVLGVDCGATLTDAVLLRGKKILKKASIESIGVQSPRALENFLQKNFPLEKVGKIALTGGGKNAPDCVCGIAAEKVNELDAIAKGSRFLSKKEKFLVANIGTGTPLLFVEGKKWRHLGGTGVGGGTIAGLGKLLLNASPLEVEKLALKGTNSLDLSVNDVVGGGIGVVPANATASNYGKLPLFGGRSPKREDVAWSLLNMVAEVIARMIVLAAKQLRCEREIVVAGRVAENPVVAQRMAAVGKMFGCKIIVPKNAAFCTAVGAALSA